MYIDTHCHLNFPQFDQDRAMVIGNAKKAGVKQFINPGVDIFSSKQSISLAQKHAGVVFAAVGIHPYEAQHDPETDDLKNIINEVTKLRSNEATPLVAIGECGLDYHQYNGEAARGKKDKQKRLFEEQLHLALKYNLPVIMHCRDGTSNVPAAERQTAQSNMPVEFDSTSQPRLMAAFDGGAFNDFFDVLDTLPAQPKGVIHCFSGGLQEVREAKRRGLFIGIDGNVTYSKHLQTIVPSIPVSMILLETDAPYLTPLPHRGTRNEPKHLPIIAKKIAELKDMAREDVETTTTVNAYLLFPIPKISSGFDKRHSP